MSGSSSARNLVMAGGGHSHALVLRRWAMHPQRKPKGLITLVSDCSYTLYSGMLPAYISGAECFDAIKIPLRQLAQAAKVNFIECEITGLDPTGQIHLKNRPALHFEQLSLNVGSITKRQHFQQAVAIKPIQHALKALNLQDVDHTLGETQPAFHVVGSGLAAIELALALRRRWPHRPLILHISDHALRANVIKTLASARIEISRDTAPDSTNTLLCTGSCTPTWLRESGLPCDVNGRVRINRHLHVIGHPNLLGAGDCAVIDQARRPASGVWAVRAAIPLATSLETNAVDKRPSPWRPQRWALQLIGAPLPNSTTKAWLQWGGLWIGPHRWIWHWKQLLDHRFVQRFQTVGPMHNEPSKNAHPSSMACRGCAAKLPEAPLEQALTRCGIGGLITTPEDAQSISTTQDNATTLTSVDGFPALLSDPWLNGRLTTLHACSDLWASGARVQAAQVIVTLPATDQAHQVELLSQTLAGVRSALAEQGAALVGGHTLESRQPCTEPLALDLQLSLSVWGTTPSGRRPWGKGGIQPGDQLLLSRALGTGVIFAAAMQAIGNEASLQAALMQMSKSQHPRLEQLLQITEHQHPNGIHACTDITGFGLLGHLKEMVDASDDITVELWLDQLPVLPGAYELLSQGITSTLTPFNRRALRRIGHTILITSKSSHRSETLDDASEALLLDPQTCGPLLISCEDLLAKQLVALGWSRIGHAFKT